MDGICVPKVDTMQDWSTIENLLSSIEKDSGVRPGTFKVIPQIESTKSFMNMKEIFQEDERSYKRINAAAFGGDDFTADFGVYRSDDDRELHFAR